LPLQEAFTRRNRWQTMEQLPKSPPITSVIKVYGPATRRSVLGDRTTSGCGGRARTPSPHP
jgi:hypothetical protein